MVNEIKNHNSTIGIDASARSTGVVILNSSPRPLKVLIKPKKLSGANRLQYIYDTLCGLLTIYSPTLAVMEGASYYSTNKPFILGEVYGICKLALLQHNVPLVLVAPRALKKYASGHGNARKEKMLSEANKLGCKTDSHDIADAWFASKLAQDILLGTVSIKTRAAAEVVHHLTKELHANQC